MEKLTRCFMSVLLLSAVLSSGLTEEKIIRDGGKLELSSNFSGDIDTVTWKLNYDMVAEWLKKFDDLTYYNTFEGRTNLDNVTGTLNITKMTPADSGVYTVEINNMVRPERYNVKVFKEVPQPVVLLQPLVSKQCILYCEGNTEGAEPVTYSWKMGEGEWMDGNKSRTIILEDKIRNITNDEETQGVETFSCRMKNPISEKQTDPIPNPFYREDLTEVPTEDATGNPPADSELWIKLLGTVMRSLAILSLLCLVVFLMWQKQECVRKLICPCLIRKDGDDYDDVAGSGRSPSFPDED
ncbi:uncharacterized protein LOC128373264 [Scomber japonicus]|uniref:uncharacterized protein LOC128373264 n=1 Tax=Scomber japonicus TaxID=13676 RepID=UPI0023067502|nr:uncharacterized protein LOC128373264 [Scomber japonicus]